MRAHVFREYLRENEKVRETVHMVPRSNILSPNNGQKSRETAHLRDSLTRFLPAVFHQSNPPGVRLR